MRPEDVDDYDGVYESDDEAMPEGVHVREDQDGWFQEDEDLTDEARELLERFDDL